MGITFESVLRQNLSADIASRIHEFIRQGAYGAGARLPAIGEMARQFGVGAPTVREALKMLEAVGVVDIRHGSGVYVGNPSNAFVISNPIYRAEFTRKHLTDLIVARIPIEMQSAELAARNATDEQLAEMRRLLDLAARSFEERAVLNQVNLSFHRQIALASGNTVLHQILDVLANLFRDEQRAILEIHGRGADDHAEHVAIYEALRDRDPALAVDRMRLHLERVREVLLRWDPEEHPVP